MANNTNSLINIDQINAAHAQLRVQLAKLRLPLDAHQQNFAALETIANAAKKATEELKNGANQGDRNAANPEKTSGIGKDAGEENNS